MKKCNAKRQRMTILILSFILLTFLSECTAYAVSIPGKNVTQNWAASAVFYNSPSDETETFHMTEEEFLNYKLELEAQLVTAYSTYYHHLSGPEQAALKNSQNAWIQCYQSYTEALAQRWQRPVKVFFGVTGKERRTNIYREFLILFLTNRITDLEDWNKGRLARTETAMSISNAAAFEESKKQLQIDMGLCLYVIQEEYRPKIKEAHRTFFDYLDSNQEFISLISQNDINTVATEGLLQIQRMNYLTSVHYQGCRFFRREREE